MSNKQIFIDCVDVSGCEYYNKDDKTCREVNGKYETDICDFDKCENSNCYYKQLSELKAENEQLEKEKKINLQRANALNRELNHLQTCLQEIKKYIAKICKEECGYVQKKRCPDCDCRYGAILDLITKAEEE